jgi:hypothetical protein
MTFPIGFIIDSFRSEDFLHLIGHSLLSKNKIERGYYSYLPIV